MRSSPTRILCRAVALAAVLCLFSEPLATGLGIDAGAPAFAQDSKRKKARRVPNMTEATHRRLSEVQEHVDAAQTIENDDAAVRLEWQQALEILESMATRTRRYNGNEIGQIHNMLALVHYELGSPLKTIEHYEKVLEQVPDITEGMENTTLQQLSRLYFTQGTEIEGPTAMEWYRKALATMEEWLVRNENPGPEAHYYMAQIYYQMEDFENAIIRLETTIRLAQERALAVKENWWSMLYFLYFERGEYLKVAEILEILVRDFPKRVYWNQLASVYGELDDPQKQLWTLEAAHVGGFLETETDLTTFGMMLLNQELPNRASKYLQAGFDDGVIEDNLKNLQALGQAYQIGGDVDKAIPVFENAAEIDEDGKTYDSLSRLYLEKDEFAKCEDAANNALEKGGLRKPLATKATLASCQFNLNKLTAARETFSEVRREARAEDDRTEERIASQWIAYIDSERRRRAALDGQ